MTYPMEKEGEQISDYNPSIGTAKVRRFNGVQYNRLNGIIYSTNIPFVVQEVLLCCLLDRNRFSLRHPKENEGFCAIDKPKTNLLTDNITYSIICCDASDKLVQIRTQNSCAPTEPNLNQTKPNLAHRPLQR